jgi:hypothetical protein
MKTILPFFLVSVLGLYCSAQENAKHENGDIVAMKQVQSALNTGNAPAYASVFDENATWDGPLGQNAIGPENIKRAAYLMFRTFGPLQFAGWKPKKLSADIWVVDMYQKVTDAHSNSWKDIPQRTRRDSRLPVQRNSGRRDQLRSERDQPSERCRAVHHLHAISGPASPGTGHSLDHAWTASVYPDWQRALPHAFVHDGAIVGRGA